MNLLDWLLFSLVDMPINRQKIKLIVNILDVQSIDSKIANYVNAGKRTYFQARFTSWIVLVENVKKDNLCRGACRQALFKLENR